MVRACLNCGHSVPSGRWKHCPACANPMPRVNRQNDKGASERRKRFDLRRKLGIKLSAAEKAERDRKSRSDAGKLVAAKRSRLTRRRLSAMGAAGLARNHEAREETNRKLAQGWQRRWANMDAEEKKLVTDRLRGIREAWWSSLTPRQKHKHNVFCSRRRAEAIEQRKLEQGENT